MSQRLLLGLGLDRPDDQAGRPYAWLTNQMAHTLAGGGCCWLALELGLSGWAVVALATAIVASLEALHWIRGGSARDSATDAGFIAAGLAWTFCGGGWLLFLGILGALAVGTAVRAL